MKIREAVRADLVFLGLEAEDAGQALGAMADRLAAVEQLDSEQVRTALVEREELGSTSVGNGFAIPHCKLNDLESVVVALGRFRNGVDFGGRNGDPEVRFFFVVLSPPDQPTEHLQVLSQIARVLKNAELRESLIESADAAAVVRAIQDAAEAEGL